MGEEERQLVSEDDEIERQERAAKRMTRDANWQLMHTSHAGHVKVGGIMLNGRAMAAIIIHGDTGRIRHALILDMWQARKLSIDGVWMEPAGGLIERDGSVVLALSEVE